MAKKQPTHITDIFEQIKNRKLSYCIAVEGGGLRGIISAAMLSVIKDFGLETGLKAIAGTSSGAINAAYFLDSKLDVLFDLYRSMASHQFIQPLKWPNAMNLDYLFNNKIQELPKPFAQVFKSKVDFFISVTDVESGNSLFKKAQNTRNEEQLIKLLRATASAPLFTRNQEKIDNQIYNDGHIGLALPFDALLKYDCDYIFCLMTRKKSYRKKDSIFNQLLATFALSSYNDQYKKAYKQCSAKYNQQMDFLFSQQNKKIIPIYMSNEDILISKMCKNPDEIDRMIQLTRKRVYEMTLSQNIL